MVAIKLSTTTREMAITMISVQRKYVPDVTKQIATAEANYLRLLKLLGDLNQFIEASIEWPTRDLKRVERLSIKSTERFNYTLTLQVVFDSAQSWCSSELTVRVYQDMCMAEVVKADNCKQYQGSYGYPNEQGLMPDEKSQVNLYFQSLLQQAKAEGLVLNKAASISSKASSPVVVGG